MIDYEKLKIAHELAEKMDIRLSIKVCFFRHGKEKYVLNAPTADDSVSVDSLDCLITKLQELTKPKPKYKINEVVWRVDDEDSPREVYIEEVDFSGDEYVYCDKDGWWVECQLYPTREALIEAQIEYWESLKKCEGNHPIEKLLPRDVINSGIQYLNKNGALEKCQHIMRKHLYNSYMGIDNYECLSCGEHFTEKDDIQICQHEGEVDRCQHETGPIASMMLAKDLICIKCFEYFLREFVEECQHESDGMIYTSNPPQNKCNKCGEFYR